MPKLDWNVFYNKYNTRVCLYVQFADYARAKAAAKKAKRPFLLADGRKVPTPGRIMAKFAAKYLKGDYSIDPIHAGAIQHLMVADPADVSTLKQVFQIRQFRQGDGKPCSLGASHSVDWKSHLHVSKQLGLL